MDFRPPRCPYPECSNHLRPAADFYRPHGSYWPKCRSAPVPRYRCLDCFRTFSRQTFRADYRDHRPETNVPLVRYLISGTGLRQAARMLGLDVHAVQKKFRKLAATLSWLHRNLLWRLPSGRVYLLDELETFEHKSIWPVTVPVLIDQGTLLVVAADAAPIRRLARTGSRRRRWQEADEHEHGRRPDHSRTCVRGMFARLAELAGPSAGQLWTDQKPLYGGLCRQVFGPSLLHLAFSGRAKRDSSNPLFPINVTNAMLRDNLGCLRRRSWLVSKRFKQLCQRIDLFVVYRNYIRRRRNSDVEADTPARLLHLLPRQLDFDEVMAWRQDWGRLSIHPMSCNGSMGYQQLA